MAEGWNRALRNADDYYLDGVALNLHGCYGGLERIFELIAAVIDGAKPKGENWHQALLAQMTEEVPGVRPAVISQATFERLDEYRGFRHVVRNVYSYNRPRRDLVVSAAEKCCWRGTRLNAPGVIYLTCVDPDQKVCDEQMRSYWLKEVILC